MEICDSAVLHNDIFINGKRHYIFYSGAHLFCQHEPKKNGMPFGIPFFLSFGDVGFGFEAALRPSVAESGSHIPRRARQARL